MTSDAQAADSPAGAELTAGAMLRAARERQGLHIAALAASIKVTPAKLDALEHDRYQELPDATFTRALAQSVCRVLKIDARPVLDKLPSTGAAALERVDAGLKTPFRERAAALEPSEWAPWRTPMFWIVVVLLGAALAFWQLPRGLDLSWASLEALTSQWSRAPARATSSAPPAAATPGVSTQEVVMPAASPAPAAAPSASAADAAASVATATATPPAATVETVHSAPVAPTAASLSSEAPDSLLVMRADDTSWVEVIDARNLVLFSRTLQPGETVGLNGQVPLRVKVGNAGATQVLFRGQAVDVATSARDNVARLELK